jgi:hypothetical protein
MKIGTGEPTKVRKGQRREEGGRGITKITTIPEIRKKIKKKSGISGKPRIGRKRGGRGREMEGG